mgnify:CR=1 FL=1
MVNCTLENDSIIARCVISTLIITTLKFMVGYIVNIVLKWNVWDYSNMPYNVKCQICLAFFWICLVLGIPITILFDALRKFFRIN